MVVVSILLFVYTFLKAYLIPFTWDEIYTYEHYVKQGFTFYANYTYRDGNNHLLNTWLMKLFSKIFGDKEFFMRLPNLLAFPFFLFYSGKLALKLSNKFLVIPSFLILVLNPYLTDYFSVARGYGLSMSLMLCGIFHAYLYVKENRSYIHALNTIFLTVIALIANLTLINYLLVISFLFVFIEFYRNKNSELFLKGKIQFTVKRFLHILSPNIILVFIVPHILNLKKSGALIGGINGFWNDTIYSLLEETIYNNKSLVNFIFIYQSKIMVL